MVHWKNKTGLSILEASKEIKKEKKTGEKKEKEIKGRKGKRSFQRNVCFASYNRKMQPLPPSDETFLICSVCQEGTMRGLGANSLSLATQNVVQGLKKTVAMDEQQGFSSSVTKAVGKLVEFQSTSSSAEGAGLDLGQPPQKLAEPRTHHFTLHSEAQGASAWCGGEKLAFFPSSSFAPFSLSPPRGKIRLNYFRRNQARITVWN